MFIFDKVSPIGLPNLYLMLGGQEVNLCCVKSYSFLVSLLPQQNYPTTINKDAASYKKPFPNPPVSEPGLNFSKSQSQWQGQAQASHS